MKHRWIGWGLVGAIAFAVVWMLQQPHTEKQWVAPEPEALAPMHSAGADLVRPIESETLESRAPLEKRSDPVALPPPDEWAAYESSSVEELTIERDRLANSLKAETTPLFFEQVRLGLAERLAEPGEFTYRSRPEDRSDIHGIVSDPDLGVYRATLSRSQFADLYEVKNRINHLDALIATKSREQRR